VATGSCQAKTFQAQNSINLCLYKTFTTTISVNYLLPACVCMPHSDDLTAAFWMDMVSECWHQTVYEIADEGRATGVLGRLPIGDPCRIQTVRKEDKPSPDSRHGGSLFASFFICALTEHNSWSGYPKQLVTLGPQQCPCLDLPYSQPFIQSMSQTVL